MTLRSISPVSMTAKLCKVSAGDLVFRDVQCNPGTHLCCMQSTYQEESDRMLYARFVIHSISKGIVLGADELLRPRECEIGIT